MALVDNRFNDGASLPLLIEDGIRGYYIDDLKKWLPEEKYIKFTKWIIGHTLLEVNGKAVVYEWDLESFMNQLTVLN